MVTNVYVKFNYDRLCIGGCEGNFRKADNNNNNNKNNVRSAWEPFPVQINLYTCTHPSSNRARCQLTTLIETNALTITLSDQRSNYNV